MRNVKIDIDTVNAAFDENAEYEVARILRELADRIEYGSYPSKLRDINGNTVGIVKVKE